VSYEDQYKLAAYDQDFRGRVTACVVEQAKIFINDDRPEFYLLARDAITSPIAVVNDMILVVTTQPGITAESTDADILSAVQFVWPTVGASRVPVTPPAA
jgi:hypothetical protein